MSSILDRRPVSQEVAASTAPSRAAYFKEPLNRDYFNGVDVKAVLLRLLREAFAPENTGRFPQIDEKERLLPMENTDLQRISRLHGYAYWASVEVGGTCADRELADSIRKVSQFFLQRLLCHGERVIVIDNKISEYPSIKKARIEMTGLRNHNELIAKRDLILLEGALHQMQLRARDACVACDSQKLQFSLAMQNITCYAGALAKSTSLDHLEFAGRRF